MEEKIENKLSLPIPVILLVAAVIAGGVFKYYAPLDSMRPPHDWRRDERQVGEEKILSRMWQDPFQAVENQVKKPRADKKSADNSAFSNEMSDSKGERNVGEGAGNLEFKPVREIKLEEKILLLPVLTTAHNYAENIEKRLRSRYAVLSALHVAGYKSDNASHIGVFEHEIIGEPRLIPYEWFILDNLNIDEVQSSRMNQAKYGKVLLFWLGDEYFAGKWVSELNKLVEDVRNKLNDHALECALTCMKMELKQAKGSAFGLSKEIKSCDLKQKKDKDFADKQTKLGKVKEKIKVLGSKIMTLENQIDATKERGERSYEIDVKFLGPSDSAALEIMFDKAKDVSFNANLVSVLEKEIQGLESRFFDEVEREFENELEKLDEFEKRIEIYGETESTADNVIDKIYQRKKTLSGEREVAVEQSSEDKGLQYYYEKAKRDNERATNKIDRINLEIEKLEESLWIALEPKKKDLDAAIKSAGKSAKRSGRQNYLQMYSPWATVNGELLKFEYFPKKRGSYNVSTIANKMNSSVESEKTLSTDINYFSNDKVNVISLRNCIHTDLQLTDELVKELKHRGVKLGSEEKDHIVIISEWDTFYGRALPLSFAISVEKDRQIEKDRQKRVDDSNKATPWPKRIHKMTYMRGLDGMLPRSDNESGISSILKATDALKRGKDNSNLGYYTPNFKQPLGKAQFDYIRRLQEKIEHLQTHAGEDNTGKALDGKVRAIGVMGSDIYDKLLILRALRPKFPNAIFFTNDLDARLFHHSELPWTRNLIVASSYGLQLHPDLQKDIPPFRNVYQSSVFVATLQALEVIGDIDFKQVRPRIFEIGRNGPYDITPTPEMTSEFSIDEFLPTFSVKALCDKIVAYKTTSSNTAAKPDGVYKIIAAPKNTTDWLNKLLRVPDLYNFLHTNESNSTMKVLINDTKGYRNEGYNILSLDEQLKITKLNRLLLEGLFPKDTPKISKRKDQTLYLAGASPDFTTNEFKQTFSVDELCDKIKSVVDNDVYKAKTATIDTTDWLNELLRFSGLYNKLGTKKSDYSNSMQTLVDETDGYRNNGYSELGYNKQMNIKRLNRLLLEETYPEYTPKIGARKTNTLHPDRHDLLGNYSNIIMFSIPILLIGWLVHGRLNDFKRTDSYHKWKEAEKVCLEKKSEKELLGECQGDGGEADGNEEDK